MNLGAWLVLAALLAQSGPDESARELDHRGWFLLEIERNPAEAAAVFEQLLQTTREGDARHQRAEVGLSRARLLLGDERTTFLTGCVALTEGQSLSLDTGGVTALLGPKSDAADVRVRGGEVEILATPLLEDEIGESAILLANLGYRPVRTRSGRAAWVDILGEGEVTVLSFATRLGGSGPILGPPDELCCVGRGDSIEVRFADVAGAAGYRIERRSGPGEPFTEMEVVSASPFVDQTATGQTRYGYRLTALGPDGDEGFPLVAQGTTEARGVIAGSAILHHGGPRSADLGSGQVFRTGGDLSLRAFSAAAGVATFVDSFGRIVGPAASGVRFRVLLRGGGSSLCRWRPVEDLLELSFESVLDDATLPAPPSLSVVRRLDHRIELRIEPHGDCLVESVFASDGSAPRETRELPVRESEGATLGVVDEPVGEGGRTYRAFARDALGRRSVSAELTLERAVTTPPPAAPSEPPPVTDPLPQGLDRWRAFIDQRAAAHAWRITDQGESVIGLLGRGFARSAGISSREAYHLATYNFVMQTRDDRAATSNYWHLEFGNGGHTIHCNLTVGQRSRLFALEATPFEEIGTAPLTVAEEGERVSVVDGRSYLLHIDGTGEGRDRWIAFEILESDPERHLVLRWKEIDDPSRVDQVERTPERMLRRGPIRIQVLITTEHAVQVTGNGLVSGYADEQLSTPFLTDNYRFDAARRLSLVFTDGGHIPDGKEFRLAGIKMRLDLPDERAWLRITHEGQPLIALSGPLEGERSLDLADLGLRVLPRQERELVLEAHGPGAVDVEIRGSLR